MAKSSEALKIIVTLKDLASQGLKGLEKNLGGLRSKINSASQAMFSLKGLLLSVGAGALAKSFLDAASTAEQYRTRLNVLLRSQKEGNRLFKEMSDYASTVSFTYEEIMGSATNLSGVMRGGVDEIKKWMPMITDLAAVSGLSLQETTMQIVRMYSAGAASADLFRDRGISAMLGFTAGVHYTAEDTRKRLIEAFTDPQSKFRGAAMKLAHTWKGMVSMMSDAWFQFRNAVMESGVYDWIKAAMTILLKAIGDLKKEGDLGNWAEAMGKTVIGVFEKIVTAVGWIGDAMQGLEMIFEGLKLSASWLAKAVVMVARGANWLRPSSKEADQMGKKLKEIDFQLYKILMNSGELHDKWAKQVPIHEKTKKLLKEIGDLAAKNRKEYEEALKRDKGGGLGDKDKGGGKGKALTEAQQIRGEMVQFEEDMRTQQAFLDAEFKKGIITIKEYYNERKAKAKEAFEYELELQRKLMVAIPANKPAERQRVELEVYKLEQSYERDMLQLELERVDAEKDHLKNIKQKVKEIDKEYEATRKARLSADRLLEGAVSTANMSGATGMLANMDQEMAELEARQASEQERMLELKKKGYADEQKLHDLHNAQILEKDKLLTKQREQLLQYTLDNTRAMLGNASNAFLDYFKATGERHKKLFQMYKEFAVAETMISTYQSAQKAYNSVVEIPYVGQALAVAAAAAAIAAGMARVAVIRSQKMAMGGLVRKLAEGGQVPGHSPTATSDNIPIAATAGEYVQPVKTVRYYGVKAMEAIRRRAIPPEVFESFNRAGYGVPMGRRLAMGGVVSGGPSGASPMGSYSVNVPITTVDTMDGLVGRLQGAAEEAVRRVLNDELG